jgi:hypothetical protein
MAPGGTGALPEPSMEYARTLRRPTGALLMSRRLPRAYAPGLESSAPRREESGDRVIGSSTASRDRSGDRKTGKNHWEESGDRVIHGTYG